MGVPLVASGAAGPGAWSLELGAKKFHEQRTTGPLLFESAPAPPTAGFNVTFEDLTLYTAAGAPLIFARLTAVRTGAYVALELLSRRVTWGRVTLTSILARRRVSRGSGEGAEEVFKKSLSRQTTRSKGSAGGVGFPNAKSEELRFYSRVVPLPWFNLL